LFRRGGEGEVLRIGAYLLGEGVHLLGLQACVGEHADLEGSLLGTKLDVEMLLYLTWLVM
jgi:hypothetical protein